MSRFSLFLTTLLLAGAVLGQDDDQAECLTVKGRPRYHFSPLKGWMNDPNGLVYLDGVYHMYYQYSPNSTIPVNMHWGHATSSDLITWQERKIAIAPDSNGQIWSGSAVVDTKNTAKFVNAASEDIPLVAIYTSYNPSSGSQTQSIAYSLDKGLNYTKYNANPVLRNSGTGNDFRDPKVVSIGNTWVMALAVKDRIHFYSSPDLKAWTKESEFGEGKGNQEGVWECPDLIPLPHYVSDKLTREVWVLLVSIDSHGPNGGSATQYFIGEFDNNNGTTKLQFRDLPDQGIQWLDWGPDNYAGVTFSNEPNNRAVYVGWMSNWNYANVTPTQGWRGQMTLPRRLEIVQGASQVHLSSTPLKEVEKLRILSQSFQADRFQVSADSQRSIELPFTNPLMEVEVSLSNVDTKSKFTVCAANSRKEEVCVGINGTHWVLDRANSGNTLYTKANTGKLQEEAGAVRNGPDDGTATIRIFIDTTSIEVFADGGITTMTALLYPTVPYDRFYVNHWDTDSSKAAIVVERFKVWGLQCWYTGEPAEEEEEENGGNSGSVLTSTVSVLVTFVIIAFNKF